MRRIGQEQALQGGKWEALMSRREDQWSEIELLEDLEDQGELDGWEGFGSTDGATQTETLVKEGEKKQQSPVDKSKSVTPPQATTASTAASQKAPPSRLGPLTISERDPSASVSSSTATTTKETPLPRRFHGSTSRARSSAMAGAAAATDEDLDSFFDLGSSAALKRSIQDVSSKLNATRLDSLPVAGGGNDDEDGLELQDEEDEEGDAVSGEEDEGLDEETRRARKEERRMLKEALQLRDDMRERGELD
jgi:hypothetical protein